MSEMNGAEKHVWCYIFMGRCIGATGVDQGREAVDAARVADLALELLRNRGLVGDALDAIRQRDLVER